MTLFGIRFIGLNWTNMQKLLFTLALFAIVALLLCGLRSFSRYLARDGRHERDLKDAMNREILTGFDAASIGIASATYDIVGFPPVRLQNIAANGDATPPPAAS